MRLANEKDLSAILGLMNEVNIEYSLGYRVTNSIKTKILNYVRSSSVYVYEKDNMIVGYIIFTLYNTLFDIRELGVVSLYITKKYRHLIRTFINKVKHTGVIHEVGRIRFGTDIGIVDRRLEKILTLSGFRTIGFTSVYTL